MQSYQNTNMSPLRLLKTLVIVVVFGYLTFADDSLIEARTLGENTVGEQNGSGENLQHDQNPVPLLEPPRTSNLDSMDMDDDEDDDLIDKRQVKNTPQMMSATGTNLFYNQPIAEQSQHRPAATGDLKTSASHHHHGHGAKGWLDMGAWTGKKGAFGWYDKHPVGKGK